MPKHFVAIALLLLSASSAAAQKHCKKGIPCGGTCISATKTCHVSAAPSETSPSSEPSAPAVTGAAVKSDTAGAWVASSRGHTYYKNGCSGANKLAVKNRIYFKSEADAKKAGYSHSAQRGC